MKKLFLLFLAIFLCLFCQNTALAERFYIENYNVVINVDENNTAHIEEEIDVDFYTPAHGIFRDIPVKYTPRYADGSKGHPATARISDIKVSERYTVSSENGNYKIKIGDPNRQILGKKKYIISYKYKMPINTHNGKQEFYFNIIGTQWPVNINKSSFTLTMPKPFDRSKAGISIGKEGLVGFNGGGFYEIRNNMVYGMFDRQLKPYEGMTIRIELPDGYFTETVSSSLLNNKNSIFYALLILITPLFIWFREGKDEKIIPVVNFNAPQGKNSAEIGAIYSGAADTKDVVSLIIYLANRGYIEIEEYINTYKLKKMKDYDGKNKAEKILFDFIFNGRNEVCIDEIDSPFLNNYMQETSTGAIVISKYNRFSECSRQIIEYLNNKVVKKIYDNSAFSTFNIIIFVCSIICILALIIYILGEYSWNFIQMIFAQDLIPVLLFPCIAIIALTLGWKIQSNIFSKIFFIIWSIFFGGIPSVIIFTSCVNDIYNIDYVALSMSIAVLVTVIICFANLGKVNLYGRRLKGEIEGFKQFIEVADKRRIDSLIAENPNYFFDILPYAYVLGVSDKWIKQFESIFQEPVWYKGSRPFNILTFKDITNYATAIAAPPSSSGGGGYSGGGGGCSGGGGGGGGGGSW